MTIWPTVTGTFPGAAVRFCAHCGHALAVHDEHGCLACELLERRYNAEREIAALTESIDWLWTRLRDAGATNRGPGRRAVSIRDQEGNDSEDEVTRTWAQWRQLVSRRQRLRETTR